VGVVIPPPREDPGFAKGRRDAYMAFMRADCK
jgi:hypothetical protein